MKLGKTITAALVPAALLCTTIYASEPDARALAERGKILVTIGACNDCHSPKIFSGKGMEIDESKLLSGHPAESKVPAVPDGTLGPDKWGALTTHDLTAWAGPWGISYAINLTPDLKTGIGSWNEEMFVKAMRTGQHMGSGRPILPPMPWQLYSQLPEQELKAVFAYLRTLKPVENAVPDPVPPVPAH